MRLLKFWKTFSSYSKRVRDYALLLPKLLIGGWLEAFRCLANLPIPAIGT